MAPAKTSKIRIGVAALLLCVAGYALFVAVGKRVQASRRATCMNNLRVMGQALRMYVTDNDGNWPTRDVWARNRISPYPLQGCPAAQALPPSEYGRKPQPVVAGYAYNANLANNRYAGSFFPVPVKDNAVRFPNLTVSVCEQASDVIVTDGPDPFGGGIRPLDREQGFRRHDNGAHYLFCDGHVHWHLPEAVQDGEDAPPNTALQPTFGLQ